MATGTRWTRRLGVGGGIVALGAGAVGYLGAAAPAASAARSSAPIVVGGQGTLPAALGVATGFKARIAAFNKAGGLDGRKITFLGMLTTAGSPTTSAANSTKLVENEHVTVDAPYISLVSTSSATGVLKTGQVPFIGWLVSGGAPGNHYGISITGTQTNPAVQSEVGMLQAIQWMKKTKSFDVHKASDVKMALIGYNTTGGTFATKTLTAAAKAAGIHVVYSGAPMPVTTTNFAPYAQTLVSSGANAVYEITDAPLSIGLSGALKAAGFKGFMVNGVTYFPGKVTSTEESPLTGVYVEDEFPTNQTHSNVVKTAEKRLKAIGASTGLSNGTSIGYWSGDVLINLLQATAKRVGAAKVTGAAIEATVAAGWHYKGGIGSLTYPKDWTTPAGCGALVKQVGKTYKAAEPFTCFPTKTAHTGL